jgi:hypothetical protein
VLYVEFFDGRVNIFEVRILLGLTFVKRSRTKLDDPHPQSVEAEDPKGRQYAREYLPNRVQE